MNAKEFNLQLNHELNLNKNKENIILIHNFPNKKRYLLKDQVHDLNEIDKLSYYFYDKNLNEKIQSRKLDTYLTEEELNETNLIIFFFKNYNFELSNKFNLRPKRSKK